MIGQKHLSALGLQGDIGPPEDAGALHKISTEATRRANTISVGPNSKHVKGEQF